MHFLYSWELEAIGVDEVAQELGAGRMEKSSILFTIVAKLTLCCWPQSQRRGCFSASLPGP